MSKIIIKYLLSLHCLCGITFSSVSDIRISIATDKSEYFVGEDIFLFVKFKNTGSKDDSIAEDKANLPMHVSASNERGEDPQRFSFTACYFEQPFIKLKPHDSMIVTVPILSYMGYGKLNNAPFGENYFFPPGIYRLYYSGSFVDIRINEPHGIDSVVSNMLIYARNIPTYVMNLDPHYQKDSVIKKINLFKEIYDSYPESPYSQKAFSLYFHYYWELNYSVDNYTFEYCKNFIYSEPNSHYVGQILHYMCRGLKNRESDESVTVFLRQIIEEFPNTNLSNFAQELTISKSYGW